MSDWTEDAACLSWADVEDFFPRQEFAPVPPDIARLCAGCPVNAECLKYAVDNQMWGIWGGTTTKDRDYARRHVKRKRPKDRPPPTCGTPSGARSHRYYLEEVCESCRVADLAEKKRYRDQRKQNRETA